LEIAHHEVNLLLDGGIGRRILRKRNGRSIDGPGYLRPLHGSCCPGTSRHIGFADNDTGFRKDFELPQQISAEGKIFTGIGGFLLQKNAGIGDAVFNAYAGENDGLRIMKKAIRDFAVSSAAEQKGSTAEMIKPGSVGRDTKVVAAGKEKKVCPAGRRAEGSVKIVNDFCIPQNFRRESHVEGSLTTDNGKNCPKNIFEKTLDKSAELVFINHRVNYD
jgi:hypothetical protein